jgi:hypothetical protein
MKWTSAASIGLAATALAADSPAGCSSSRDGTFQVSIYSLGAAKRNVEVNYSSQMREGIMKKMTLTLA